MKLLKKTLSDSGHTMYIKQLKKEEPGIADFKINGSIINDNKSKADILNNQFSNVFTQEELSNIPDETGALQYPWKPLVLDGILSH